MRVYTARPIGGPRPGAVAGLDAVSQVFRLLVWPGAQLILEHYRHPRNKGELADHTVEAHVANPVCGDEVKIQIRLDGDRIEEIAFDGQGCSISQASVSMMTGLVKGTERSDAIRLADLFTDMMHGNEDAASDRSLGNLRALQGVSKSDRADYGPADHSSSRCRRTRAEAR